MCRPCLMSMKVPFRSRVSNREKDLLQNGKGDGPYRAYFAQRYDVVLLHTVMVECLLYLGNSRSSTFYGECGAGIAVDD